jgi:SAM-dependent methyltransferase
MPTPTPPSRNWFDQGGEAYARFRPEYPPALAAFLAAAAPDRALAVDAGCGNGQLTQLLAPCFERVIGIDPSADQIANAGVHERIAYRCAPAERMPVDDGCASLVTAAQAAHWFDLPAFYREVRRIARPAALLALVSYGVLALDADLDRRFQHFYHDEIGPFWPAQRKLVDTGYATIDFPFEELAPPALDIRCAWTLPQFLGYVSTWSAVRSAREAGRDVVGKGAQQVVAAAWGDPGRERPVRWPINMRLGRV